MTLRVQRVDAEWAGWDRFVAESPASTFAHRSGWHDLLRGVFGHECEYLLADDDGRCRGVLPLVHLRGVIGHFLLSMPFLNDGGPIGDAEACALLVDAAVQRARDSGAKVLELRSREAVPGQVHPSFRKVAVHLRLPATTEELWEKTFKSKLRSQIRRPVKEGMITKSGVGELDTFYKVFARNMRDLGTPVLPRAFFHALASMFGEDVMFTSVYTGDGVRAAAACCLVWRDEMEITWASSVRELNKLSPNMLLYASVMEEAVRRGVRLFNFGRSTPGAPTHKFKQQWGGLDVPLPWTTWPPAADDASPGGAPLMRAASAVWRRLPLAIANRLGARISGQLPW